MRIEIDITSESIIKGKLQKIRGVLFLPNNEKGTLHIFYIRRVGPWYFGLEIRGRGICRKIKILEFQEKQFIDKDYYNRNMIDWIATNINTIQEKIKKQEKI